MAAEIIEIRYGKPQHGWEHSAQSEGRGGQQDSCSEAGAPPRIFDRPRDLEQDRLTDPCNQKRPGSGKQKKSGQDLSSGTTIGQPAAERVTTTHRGQDNSDQRAPDEKGIAKDRRQEPATENFQRHHDRASYERRQQNEPA